MLHYPYFKGKDEIYYEVVNEIYKDLSQFDAETFGAIGRLNESQFFLFLANYIYYFRFEDISISTLKHFFYLECNQTIEDNDPLPFQDFLESQEANTLTIKSIESLVLNCNKELSKLASFYIGMREYPKDTLSHMLLFLSENINIHVLFPLTVFKTALIDYLDNESGNETNISIDKISFLLEIKGALIDYENYLEKLQCEIHDKVSSLNKSKIDSKKGNYQIGTSTADLHKLYHSLEKFMFINQNKTSLKQFIEVLEEDWESHNSVVYFEMDNILFKYFIDYLETYFDIKMQLSSIEYSGKIANKNGLIKAGRIYSSVAQYRKFLKKREDINCLKSIFEKIKNY